MNTFDRDQIEKALVSPDRVFQTPGEVQNHAGLTRELKLRILRQWEIDDRALQRATDENMSGGQPSRLEEIREAIRHLGGDATTLEGDVRR